LLKDLIDFRIPNKEDLIWKFFEEVFPIYITSFPWYVADQPKVMCKVLWTKNPCKEITLSLPKEEKEALEQAWQEHSTYFPCKNPFNTLT
jgi:hypothetical protein